MKTSSRRKFLGTAAALCAGSAAAAMPLPAGNHKFPIVHHVFFWLKNPGSTADRDKLVEGIKTLSRIPAVGQLHVGVVANTEKREVVDASWAVSELIFFRDLASQAAYQTHPIHLDFVKNYSSLWEKVVVYDAQEV
ncbi:Dabb family protein [Chitinophaga sp. G-6-1-13]|uniref:Dabb family protein n=1 Tax=Chitinophaga fulva TaxID=2728842 RepID=A0A848GIU9_9BACT|nr:Dabb family protein [Chitinophaga fulva]NML37621.1 Dabb family protein [Chitinophaga fulva]